MFNFCFSNFSKQFNRRLTLIFKIVGAFVYIFDGQNSLIRLLDFAEFKVGCLIVLDNRPLVDNSFVTIVQDFDLSIRILAL